MLEMTARPFCHWFQTIQLQKIHNNVSRCLWNSLTYEETPHEVASALEMILYNIQQNLCDCAPLTSIGVTAAVLEHTHQC